MQVQDFDEVDVFFKFPRYTGVYRVASRMRGEGFASNEVDSTIGFSSDAAANVLDLNLDRKSSPGVNLLDGGHTVAKKKVVAKKAVKKVAKKTTKKKASKK
jgi:hypothetical protein